jgi:nitrogen fixation-related uncharacterized protein
MLDPERTAQERGAVRKAHRFRRTILCLSLLILVPAGIGFSTKLIQFVRTSRTDEQGGFAILPLLLYLAVSAGFLCLFLWAAFQGMFRDIERPKHTMLETEERLEQAARQQGGRA